MFEKGDFISHSGIPLDWKIECNSLTDADIECLAYLISKKFSFRNVFGIPRGGMRLARALGKYQSQKYDATIIVDDVLTTGNSMETMRKSIPGPVVGVVIFSRLEDPPSWIFPIFKFKLDD